MVGKNEKSEHYNPKNNFQAWFGILVHCAKDGHLFEILIWNETFYKTFKTVSRPPDIIAEHIPSPTSSSRTNEENIGKKTISSNFHH